MKMICDSCGSDDIYRKRISYFKKGAWIDEEFADEYHCNSCGSESVEPVKTKPMFIVVYSYKEQGQDEIIDKYETFDKHIDATLFVQNSLMEQRGVYCWAITEPTNASDPQLLDGGQ